MASGGGATISSGAESNGLLQVFLAPLAPFLSLPLTPSIPAKSISPTEYQKIQGSLKSLGILLDPKDPQCSPADRQQLVLFLCSKAKNFQAKGEVAGAARLYQTAQTLDPSNKDLCLDAARALKSWAEKEVDPAVKMQLYQEAFSPIAASLSEDKLDLSLAEISKDILKNLGSLELEQTSHKAEGVIHLQFYLSLGGTLDPVLLDQVIGACVELGDYASAVKMGEERLKLFEEPNRNYEIQIAQWAILNHDPQKAYDIYKGSDSGIAVFERRSEDPLEKQVLEIFHSDKVWVEAAQAYLQRGDFFRAKQILEFGERVLRVDSDAHQGGSSLHFNSDASWKGEHYNGPSIAETKSKIDETLKALPERLKGEIQKLQEEILTFKSSDLEKAVGQLEFLEGVQHNLQILEELSGKIKLYDVSKEASQIRSQILTGVLYGNAEFYEKGMHGLEVLARYQAVEARKLAAYEAIRSQYPSNTRFVFETDFTSANPRVRPFLNGEKKLLPYEMPIDGVSHIAFVESFSSLDLMGTMGNVMEDLRNTRIPQEGQKPVAPSLEADEKREALASDYAPNMPPGAMGGLSLEAETERLEGLYGGEEVQTFLKKVQEREAQETPPNEGALIRLQLQKQLGDFQAFVSQVRDLENIDLALQDPEDLETLRGKIISTAQDYKIYLKAKAERFASEDEKDRPLLAPPADGKSPPFLQKSKHWVSPRVAEILKQIEGIDSRLEKFQALDLNQTKSLANFTSFAQDLLRFKEEHVKALLGDEIRVMRTEDKARQKEMGSDAHLVFASLQSSLDAIDLNQAQSNEEVLKAYAALSTQVDDAAFVIAVDNRITMYEQMQKSVHSTDRLFNAGLAIAELGSDHKSGLSSNMAGDFKELIEKYQQVKRLYQEGKTEEAKKIFFVLETANLHSSLQRDYEFSTQVKWVSTFGVIIAAAATGGIAAELAGPELIAMLGPGAAAETAGLAINALVFTASSRALNAGLSGDLNDFYDSHKSFGSNVLGFVEEAALNFGMFKFLGKSQQLFAKFFERRLLGMAEKQLIKEGILKSGEKMIAGSAQEAALLRRAALLGEKLGSKIVFTAGAFATELGAFGAWDFIALNYQLAKEGEFDPLGAAKQSLFTAKAWEDRFVFLIALKIGGALASPITTPLHEWAADVALGPYRGQLAKLDAQISETSQKLQAFFEGKGGNVFELADVYKKALLTQKAILDKIPQYRNPQTYALNDYLLKQIDRFEKEYKTYKTLSDYGMNLTALHSGTYPLARAQKIIKELQANPLCSVEIADNGLLTIQLPNPSTGGDANERLVTLRLTPDRSPTPEEVAAMKAVPKMDPASNPPETLTLGTALGAVLDEVKRICTKFANYPADKAAEKEKEAIRVAVFNFLKAQGSLPLGVRDWRDLSYKETEKYYKKLQALHEYQQKYPGKIKEDLPLAKQIEKFEALQKAAQAPASSPAEAPRMAARGSEAPLVNPSSGLPPKGSPQHQAAMESAARYYAAARARGELRVNGEIIRDPQKIEERIQRILSLIRIGNIEINTRAEDPSNPLPRELEPYFKKMAGEVSPPTDSPRKMPGTSAVGDTGDLFPGLSEAQVRKEGGLPGSIPWAEIARRLRSGKSMEEIAREINGTEVMARVDNLEVARAVVAIADDIEQARLHPEIVAKRQARLIERVQAAIAKIASTGAPLALGDYLKLLDSSPVDAEDAEHYNIDPAYFLIKAIKEGKVKAVILSDAEYDATEEKEAGDTLHSFGFYRNKDTTIFVRQLPHLDLKTPEGRVEAMKEIYKRLEVFIHEGEHWRHFNDPKISLGETKKDIITAAEMLAFMAQARWRAVNFDSRYVDDAASKGQNLAQYWRTFIDSHYLKIFPQRAEAAKLGTLILAGETWQKVGEDIARASLGAGAAILQGADALGSMGAALIERPESSASVADLLKQAHSERVQLTEAQDLAREELARRDPATFTEAHLDYLAEEMEAGQAWAAEVFVHLLEAGEGKKREEILERVDSIAIAPAVFKAQIKPSKEWRAIFERLAEQGSSTGSNNLERMGPPSAPPTSSATSARNIRTASIGESADESAEEIASGAIRYAERKMANVGGNFAGHILEYVRNNHIKDQDILVKIAERSAVQDGFGTSKLIQEYGIQDQAALIEIAKIAARHGTVEEHIQNYSIKDEKARIEIAKIAADRDGILLSQHIKNFGIQDPNALIEIAKIAAQHTEEFSDYIQNYGIRDQKVLVEIAKIEAAGAESDISLHIKNYRITDPRDLLEIAKIAARTDQKLLKYIKNYGISDPADLIEIVKIAAARFPTVVSKNIKASGIQDQKALVEIAKIAARLDGTAVSACIADYGIEDEKARVEIAKLAVFEDPVPTSIHIQNYDIQDEAARVEVAKLAAAQNGGETSKHIKGYSIKDAASLIEIAKIAAACDGGGTSKHIQNYGIKNQAALIEIAKMVAAQGVWSIPADYVNRFGFGISDSDALAEIAKITLLNHPDYNLFRHLVYHHLVLPWISIDEPFTIQALTGAYLKELKFDPELAKVLAADVQKEEVATVLAFSLLDLAKNHPETLRALAQKSLQDQSRFLLAQLIGLDPALLENRSISSRALGDFYEYTLHLQQGFVLPAFEGLRFSQDLFKDKKLTALLELMHSFSLVKGILGPQAFQDWQLALREIRRGEESIHPSHIKSIQERAEQWFLAKFQQVFQIKGRKISMQEIHDLGSKWANLDVFYTLIARFTGNANWREEVPLLGRVVEAVLAGRFEEAKYEGLQGDEEDLEKAKAQTAMLDDAGKAAWREEVQTIGIFNTREAASAKSRDQLWRNSKPLIAQTLGHVRELDAKAKLEREKIDSIKGEIQKEPKTPTVLKFKKAPEPLRQALFELLAEAGNEKDYQQILGLIRANRSLLKLNTQVEDDFKALDAAMKYEGSGNEAIVFTTTTDDPKLLLMTGDLVNTSSCQNYKTGTHIETLLAYVMDAGVKLVLSYALQAKDFKSPKDYERAKALIKAGAKVEFVAAAQQLKIGDIVIDLPKAYKRRVIKLGSTPKGKAGLSMEPEYKQNHFAEGEMGRQMGEVFLKLAQKIHAHTDKTIRIPPSRNPGGIYSDSSGGIQRDSYQLKPVE